MKGFFITATGTEVGKTYITCALTRACLKSGKSVAAIKPLETDCNPDALDARALAIACQRPELATASGLYRAREPLAPYAATKRGGPTIGSLPILAQRVHELSIDVDVAFVEGAGGVLVPLDAEHTMLDFASEVGWPIILVWGCSSVGRALRSQCRGQGFDSPPFYDSISILITKFYHHQFYHHQLFTDILRYPINILEHCWKHP